MKLDSMSFFNEGARKATYKRWAFARDKPCNADKMAEAGFIFTGSSKEPDSAQCFFCHKHLDGWEEADNPWREHLKHAPNCEFAQLQKPQDEVTLKEWLDLIFKFEENHLRKSFSKRKQQVRDDLDDAMKAIDKCIK